MLVTLHICCIVHKVPAEFSVVLKQTALIPNHLKPLLCFSRNPDGLYLARHIPCQMMNPHYVFVVGGKILYILCISMYLSHSAITSVIDVADRRLQRAVITRNNHVLLIIFPPILDIQYNLRGHPFITSTRRGNGSGSGGRMWTGGGGPAPCGRPHRKLKLEPTDVILSSSHAKKLASFYPEFRLWTEKSGKCFCDTN